MLNEVSIKEAISIAVMARDKLPLNDDLPLKERWLERDALAVLINYATKKLEEEKNGLQKL